MKFFLRFFTFCAVLVLIFVVVFNLLDGKEAFYAKMESSMEPTIHYENGIAKSPTQENQSSTQQASSPRVVSSVNYGLIVQRACLTAGVDLVSQKDGGLTQLAAIRWRGENAVKGGEFLDVLLREGRLRDFEEVTKPRIYYNDRGEVVHEVHYRLFMK